MNSTTTSAAGVIEAEAVGALAGAAESVPQITDAVTEAETIAGQHGTNLETRLTGLEALIADIAATLAHLFPTHFPTPK